MRKTSLAAVAALVALAAGCSGRDVSRSLCLTEGLRDLTPWRWVEPRLSGGFATQPCRRSLPAGHAVAVAICPAPHLPAPSVSRSPERCDEAGRLHVAALRTLILSPNETEEAVEMLESLAARDPGNALVLSDLAAAYQVRAQREDRPADLLRSFAAAERAVALGGRREARLNRALADEGLRLPGPTPLPEAAVSSDLVRRRLAALAGSGEAAAVDPLVATFPDAALRSVEEDLLPGWAAGRGREAAQRLALARRVAGALARQTGDRLLARTVAEIAGATPHREATLRQGCLAFGRARHAERAQSWRQAEEDYGQAQRLLAAAASPLRAEADLGLATARFERAEVPLAQVLAQLAPLAQEAAAEGYHHLLGRALWIRALCLFFDGRAVESLDALDRARASFERMKDAENAAGVRVRKAGILRALGQGELAWREVFLALPHLPRIIEPQSQHHLLGEAAAVALAMGQPAIALRYQDEAVGRIERERAATPPKEAARISGLVVNLAIALRERAGLLLHAGRPAAAAQDLDRAIALAAVPSDATARQALEARVEQVKGETLLAGDPAAAATALQEARRLSPPEEYPTFRAQLSFELARAYRGQGKGKEAEAALVQGIRDLQQDARILLDGRRRGQGEELWSGYFSRFQDAYRLLIQLLADAGRPAEAFAYAEKARAYEPLNLVLQLPNAPAAFSRLVADGEPLRLEEVRRNLPRGTVLLEYSVLDDRVLIWAVWHGGAELVVRPVGRATVAGWTAALQALASARRVEDFERALAEPYEDLVAAPLERLSDAGLRGEAIRTLVFVPDGPIHGLPLAALHPRGSRHDLIADYRIAVAPSATLYIFSRLRDRDLPAGEPVRVLLVGDPAFDPSSDLTRGLSRLPGAAAEVEDIRGDYPGARVLTGPDATAGRFLALAGESAVVHVAAHAVGNPGSPLNTRLVLAPGDGHSGLLSATDLLRELRLEKTRLVVLSACRSAGGPAIGPGGLAPLVRPFLAAGAPAVVGSLWDVGEVPARELLSAFHRHYAAGDDAESSLRAAQLDLSRRRPALAWAPFQVVGYASSPANVP
jgi:CHAT domain-containing protein